MEQEWAPPTHPVFRLVPEEFEYHARNLYTLEGCPPVSHRTFPSVFHRLRDAFLPYEVNYPLASYIGAHEQDHDREHESVAILPGLKNLRLGEEMGIQCIEDEDEDDRIPPVTVRPDIVATGCSSADIELTIDGIIQDDTMHVEFSV
jgi:hypothetical protein